MSPKMLGKEEQDSLAAETYTNHCCCKKGHENDEKYSALVEALKSDKAKILLQKNTKEQL